MGYRKWDDPEIEDWEDDSEFRSEYDRQFFIGFHCWPRRFCWLDNIRLLAALVLLC